MQPNPYFKKNRNLFYPKNNVYKFVLIINFTEYCEHIR